MKLAFAAASALLVLGSSVALAEPPPATTGPVDALVSAPGNFKLLLENDQIRVLQYTLLPGALDHWHTHPRRVGYLLSGGKIRVTEADGTHEDYDEKTGEIYWGDFSALHDTLNIGATPYVALLVEVKSADSMAAPADEVAIRAARTRFNEALTGADFHAIGDVLADDVQMITSADSMIIAGKAAQIALWSEDLRSPKRRVYTPTADRVQVSPVGRWRSKPAIGGATKSPSRRTGPRATMSRNGAASTPHGKSRARPTWRWAAAGLLPNAAVIMAQMSI